MKHQIYLYLIKSTFYFLICFLLCFYFLLSYSELHILIINNQNIELDSIYQINSYTLQDETKFYSFIFLISITWLIISTNLYYLYLNSYTSEVDSHIILKKSLYFIALCSIVYFSLLVFNGFDNHLYLIFANTIPIKTYNDNLIFARYYNNLADPEIIFTIKTENKGKAGIYRLTNKINGKYYIGSSSNLDKRFYAYFSPSGLKRTERLIVREIIKYGLINFSFEILEYVELKDKNVLFLLEREQYYFDLLKPEYNILKIARSSNAFKFSQETKIKLPKIKGKGE